MGTESPMTDDHMDRIIAGEVESAQAVGLSVGEACCHPSLPIIRVLKAIEGDVAVLRDVRGGDDLRFPLAECFDPNVLLAYSARAVAMERTFSMN